MALKGSEIDIKAVNIAYRNHKYIVFYNMAECTVESLINQRCKGKQHMCWSREGVHSILQIRPQKLVMIGQ